ncbi:efflux RND transporter periplasmic adaptor subunit [Dysgonomonas sp. HDW5B]|uniref:efflux RND transporter periplasmic adaptor subunit n=1 Tax=Dysgonomonas sp. HDW5B TaxID=2714927 RepID=UPI00140C24A6|nr:efflux RND transporter periplasmic adaptor subunit [Dysgonomonas sp. HDW5B]QIK55522.1 efflux RND transporter periplasmic adaptor subunit [Dysgonomonas sp. HDW5B]
MKKYNYIFSILVGFALIACGGEKKAGEETSMVEEDNSVVVVTKDQFKTMKMEISPLVEKDFDVVIKASGKIDVPPQNRAKVTSFVGGFVKSLYHMVGDKVSKGQPLLILESPEYLDIQQSYLEIFGQLSYLKSEYERQRTLFNEKIASQKKYMEAESDYKKAKATYESLRQKLRMLNISPEQVEQGKLSSSVTVYAPITGDITIINANMGMAVSPSDVIMEIVDTKFLHLELSVFEKNVFDLKNGQKVKFIIPQISSDEFEATVSLIGKSVEGNDRIVTVYASLDESTKQKLLTGMFVEAQIVASSKKVLSVPVDALTSEESNQFLLVLESEKDGNYTFRKTLVKTGDRNGEWIEVILDNNIKADAQILVKGVYDVI